LHNMEWPIYLAVLISQNAVAQVLL
jgi:hypothetical protein